LSLVRDRRLPPLAESSDVIRRPGFVKTIWKGAISFGLVTIPVRVYGATEAKSLRFHQLHEPDGGRVRYKRVCSVDGEEIDYAEIVKGYEYEKDHYVTLTDEELDSLPVSTAKAIEIERFVEADEIPEGLLPRARGHRGQGLPPAA
jgi:Ku protein